MFSRLATILLVVLVAASMIPQTQAFTAGAGNIGNGKRTVDHKNQITFRLRRICEAAEIACSSLKRKNEEFAIPMEDRHED